MPLGCPSSAALLTTSSLRTWPDDLPRLLLALLYILVAVLMAVGSNPVDGINGNDTYSSLLQVVNPWLSACDLADPFKSPDLQGTCSFNTMRGPAHHSNNSTTSRWRSGTYPRWRITGNISEGPGPPEESTSPCSRVPACRSSSNTTTTPHQCLSYLDASHKASLCGRGTLSRRQKWDKLRGLRLRHCCERSVLEALGASERDAVLREDEDGRPQCAEVLNALSDLDALVGSLSCKFTEVLLRYDCEQNYSVVFQCDDCKESYRQWVCGSLFPYFPGAGQLRVRPCRTECQRVEQKCPFFLPGDRAPPWDRAPVYPTQYAGEPTFLCLDPNIPETGDQLAKSSYGPQGCCYAHCGNELCHSGCRPNTTAGPTASQHARHCSATPLTYPDQQRGAGLSACAPTFTMVASGGVAALPARHPPPCWTTVLLKLLFHMCVVVNTLNNSLLHLTARFALVQAVLMRLLWESA